MQIRGACCALARTIGLGRLALGVCLTRLSPRSYSKENRSRWPAARRRNRPDIPAARLDLLRDLINRAVRDCLVQGYEPLIKGLKLPDPDDRHVLAAAIKAGAQVIVTRNLRDFPRPNWGNGESRQSDAFVLDQVGINVRAVAASVRQIGLVQPHSRDLSMATSGNSSGEP